jgi:hypothetical protein
MAGYVQGSRLTWPDLVGKFHGHVYRDFSWLFLVKHTLYFRAV